MSLFRPFIRGVFLAACCWALFMNPVMSMSAGDQKSSNKTNDNRNRNAAEQWAQDSRVAAQAVEAAESVSERIESLQRKITTAKSRLKAREEKMRDAQGPIDRARSSVESNQSRTTQLAANLRKIEESIERQQSDNSSLATAWRAFQEARDDLQARENALAQRLGQDSSAAELIAAKEKDAGIRDARQVVARQHQAWEVVRAELFGASTRWVQVNRSLAESRRKLGDAEKQLAAAVAKYNQHRRDAIAEQQAIDEANALKRSLERQKSAAENTARRLSSKNGRSNKQRERSDNNRRVNK